MRHSITSLILLLLLAASNGFVPPRPAAAFSSRPTPLPTTSASNSDHQGRLARLQRWKDRSQKIVKRTSKTVASVVVAWVIASGRNPALADMIGTKAPPGLDTSLRANEILVQSLRPDATIEDAESAVSGKSVRDQRNVIIGMSTDVTEKAPKTKKAGQKKVQKSLYYDDEEEDDQTEELFGDSETTVKPRSGAAAARFSSSSTSSAYAAVSKGPSKGMYVKSAAIILTIPAVWLTTREYLRRRGEEEYVIKSMAILEAQKAEFFNVTASKNDEDINDELKDLKKNSTDTKNDDDDNDDDDDDDDDDDESPKRPKGGRGGKK